MKTISHVVVLLCFFLSIVSRAQTPYDDFAPAGQPKPILCLQEATFKVYNPDSTGSIRYVELDKEIGLLSYYDKDDSLLGSFTLAEVEAKWQSTDPLAKKYPSVSPYNFCSDNPTNRVDADGQDDFTFHTITYMTTSKGAYGIQMQARKITSVEVVRNNLPNTYAAHNIVVHEDLVNNKKDFSETYTDVHKNSGQYLSENWGEVLNHYPPEMSQTGSASNFLGLAEAKRSKDNYEWDKKETETNIQAFKILLSAVPIESFFGEATALRGSELNSFESIAGNPQALWGKSANEVQNILGEGWTKGTYGSNGQGWKFVKGDKSVFYNASSSAHGGSEYYGFSSGALGKNKIVNPKTYVPRSGDKATIIKK